MRFYFAGKVSHSDWRHDIVSGLRDAMDEYTPGDIREIRRNGMVWPVLKNSVFGEHSYAGPYFISCDHGCAHGENRHGVATMSDDEEEEYDNYSGDKDWHGSVGDGCFGSVSRRSLVKDLCLSAIDSCDVVFCWLDSLDAFGTLVELGYASAIGKTIWIASVFKLDDMWFAYEMADKVIYAKTATDGLKGLLGYTEYVDYYKYIQSDAWRVKATDAKMRAGWRCQICNKRSDDTILDAHHRTYERLGNELPEDITVLCRDCHQLYESHRKSSNKRG